MLRINMKIKVDIVLLNIIQYYSNIHIKQIVHVDAHWLEIIFCSLLQLTLHLINQQSSFTQLRL